MSYKTGFLDFKNGVPKDIIEMVGTYISGLCSNCGVYTGHGDKCVNKGRDTCYVYSLFVGDDVACVCRVKGGGLMCIKAHNPRFIHPKASVYETECKWFSSSQNKYGLPNIYKMMVDERITDANEHLRAIKEERASQRKAGMAVVSKKYYNAVSKKYCNDSDSDSDSD